MSEDMARQVDAIFPPATKVYCGNCYWYVPEMVTKYGILEAQCRHANARFMQDTFEGLQLISISPQRRNAQNDCQDWARRTFFSDLGHNPLKLLMLVFAMLIAVYAGGRVLFL